MCVSIYRCIWYKSVHDKLTLTTWFTYAHTSTTNSYVCCHMISFFRSFFSLNAFLMPLLCKSRTRANLCVCVIFLCHSFSRKHPQNKNKEKKNLHVCTKAKKTLPPTSIECEWKCNGEKKFIFITKFSLGCGKIKMCVTSLAVSWLACYYIILPCLKRWKLFLFQFRSKAICLHTHTYQPFFCSCYSHVFIRMWNFFGRKLRLTQIEYDKKL